MVFTAVWLTSVVAWGQPVHDTAPGAAPEDGSEPIDVTVDEGEEDGGDGSEPIDVTVDEGEEDGGDGSEPIDVTVDDPEPAAPDDPAPQAPAPEPPAPQAPAPEPPAPAEPGDATPAAPAPRGDDAEVDLTGDAPPPPDPNAEEETSWLDAPATRRSGFTFGILLGSLMGNVEGYPNDALKIDRDAFRTNTGFSGGGFGHAFIGVTFTDWIGFGIGGGYGALVSDDHETRSLAIDFRIDAWPFYGLGGVGEDLGINFTAGLGASNTTLNEGDDTRVVDGALTSHVATGVFWEPIQLWRINMGPFASFDAQFSQSVFQGSAWIGWRTVLYSGPSRDEEPEGDTEVSSR